MAQAAPTSTGPYLCTATRLRVRGPRQLGAFLRVSAAAAKAARNTPGNLRTRLLGMPPLLTFQSLSVWESREAMLQFVKSPEHRAAMAQIPELALRSRFVTFETQTPRVSWRRAGRMLRDPDAVWTPEGEYRRTPA
jgi:heme-degrading monooxygenase HmoA